MAESKAVRQARVRLILERHAVSSQAELGELLAAEGITVSQGTLSKDLLELGAVRQRDDHGRLVYALPPVPQPSPKTASRLERLCREVLLGTDTSGNLVILKTSSGAAQYFASAIDLARLQGVLGTLAGDDTVLVVAAESVGGPAVADMFRAMGRSR